MLALGLMGADLTPGELMFQEGAAYRSEGRQLQEAGDPYRALAAFRMAVVVNPTYAEAFNDLGVVLESVGRAGEAEEAYKRALQLDPYLGGAHSNLALLYEKAGKGKEAGEHWAARVRLGPPYDPWVAKAREKLAHHNLPIPEPAPVRPEQRKAEAKRALTAGRAHLEAKRWDLATAEFQRALSLEPGSREANRLLRQVAAEREKQELRRQKEIDASAGRVRKQAEALRKPAKLIKKAEPVKKKPEPVKKKPERIVEPVVKEAKPVKELPPVKKVPPAVVTKAPEDARKLAEQLAAEKRKVRKATIQELSQRGVAAMRASRYDEAMDLFRQILILDPGNRDAQQSLQRAEKAKAKAAKTAGRSS